MPLDSVHHTPTPAAKRGSKWPSLALALALHLGLGLLLFWGWRSHSIPAEDDAAPAQIGLWTSADIAHAAKAPETAKEAPQPKTKPAIQHERPTPPDDAADIHLGQTKPKKKHTPTPAPTVKPSPSPTHQPTAKPTEKPKAKPSPVPTHKPTADPRIEQAKAEKIAQEKARQDALKRMLGEAKNAGQAGGSTTSAHNGMGKSAYKPSNDYVARVSAIIKRNTHFDANSIDGNPTVKIEIRLSPDGTILGRPRIVRSSGQADWDAAAVEGIERAEVLPRDPILGMAPPVMVIDRKPKD